MGFLEGRIDGEKVFRETLFPKSLFPSSVSDSGIDALVATVERERDSLANTLRSHGAILFRDFEVRTAEEFDRVVVAFGWEEMDHLNLIKRTRLTDRVYTTNDEPVDRLINFHHEMSLRKESPGKILFYCNEPAPEGGETSIVLSNVIVEKMEERLPEVMAKLSDVGLIFRNKTPKASADATWNRLFQTDDEAEAEKRAMEVLNCNSVNFNKDGTAEIVFGPANPIREFGGKRVWFMPFLGFTDDINDVKNSFGDGSTLPTETMATYREIVEENCVDVKWRKGDIMLVDNYAVQHARRPGKPPRVILVSICN